MNDPIFQIDAFADNPFTGNPAAVVIAGGSRPEDWMQLFAREMNLSETAFLEQRDEEWHIRWFTPKVEVDLCGHATLAAAHALWESERVPASNAIRFRSRGGTLHAVREGAFIWLDFPAKAVEEIGPGEERSAILDALGLAGRSATFIGHNAMDAFVQFESAGDVLGFTPDFDSIAALPFRGLTITAPPPDGATYDFLSRFFAPRAGVDEDPVTGSAHCALAPFWSNRLGENALTGLQASPRNGTVKTRVEGSRVFLGGKAVTVLRGTIEAIA